MYDFPYTEYNYREYFYQYILKNSFKSYNIYIIWQISVQLICDLVGSSVPEPQRKSELIFVTIEMNEILLRVFDYTSTMFQSTDIRIVFSFAKSLILQFIRKIDFIL